MDFITPFIEWLLKSDYIAKNKLFFNAITAGDNTKQIVSQQINKAQDVEFVDGSILHTVMFTIFDFKSISFNQLVKTHLDKNENITDLLEVGDINAFIIQKDKEKDYPDFGNKFEVQRIYPNYVTPSTPSIDTNMGLAKYSIPVICEVLELAN